MNRSYSPGEFIAISFKFISGLSRVTLKTLVFINALDIPTYRERGVIIYTYLKQVLLILYI